MKAIVNTKLVMEDGIICDGALTYENGRIVQVGTADAVTIPEGAEIIDAKGLYTAPGLIDIHNHGSADDLDAVKLFANINKRFVGGIFGH